MRGVWGHFLEFCPLVGMIVEHRRATDQDVVKKIAVVLAVPALTAIGTALVVYGSMGQWQTKIEGQMSDHQHLADARTAELLHRIERLENEIRDTHKQLVEFMLTHSEQDRREFNDLRRGQK